MSRSQIFKLIYAGIGIFGTYLLAARLLEGEWLLALIPLAVVVLCGYRLFTMDEE